MPHENNKLELTVMIQRVSGNFEVIESKRDVRGERRGPAGVQRPAHAGRSLLPRSLQGGGASDEHQGRVQGTQAPRVQLQGEVPVGEELRRRRPHRASVLGRQLDHLHGQHAAAENPAGRHADALRAHQHKAHPH
ncbi:hypothetical protein D910_05294 [Dendroctonus ponderosae]|uniref:Uncharacterized protein n=1 Tax=Dendroctonus ponderosae TaxID=77166 RepID=U4UBE5_DENPD|nr:hypothetical protein D910_05294 [Dendroctonus ponderosae]